MTDERLQILRMVQDGKVSADDALKLLDALGQEAPPKAGSAARTGKQKVRLQTTRGPSADE